MGWSKAATLALSSCQVTALSELKAMESASGGCCALHRAGTAAMADIRIPWRSLRKRLLLPAAITSGLIANIVPRDGSVNERMDGTALCGKRSRRRGYRRKHAVRNGGGAKGRPASILSWYLPPACLYADATKGRRPRAKKSTFGVASADITGHYGCGRAADTARWQRDGAAQARAHESSGRLPDGCSSRTAKANLPHLAGA